MSKYCVCCGSPLPDNHRHRTCSMCYGDPYWGTDGYMLQAMEEDAKQQAEREEEEQEQEQEWAE